MKLYRNTAEIRRKERMGRRLSLTGLGILFVGLLASFIPTWLPPGAEVANPALGIVQQNWMWLSFAALPLGFIFASFGSYFINRYARRRWPGSKTFARPDEVLARNMKGFDDKYTYFAWSLPANHVLVGPCGIILMVLRSDRGKVNVQGERWREPFSFTRFFTVFAREGVGNPSFELEEQTRKLEKILGDLAVGPEEEPQPAPAQDAADAEAPEATDAEAKPAKRTPALPIQPVVVFLNPEMQLNLENPTVPVLRADQFKDHVRKRAREVKAPTSAIRKVVDQLSEEATYQAE